MLANPQLKCRVLSTPLEIRRMIYTYLFPHGIHARLHQGTFHLSPCIEPCTNNGPYGDNRHPAVSSPGNPVYKRRLQSSWGTHWRCEEVALGIEDAPEVSRKVDMAILLACRKVCTDVLDFTVQMSTVHVTDLVTLHHLLEIPSHTSPSASIVSQSFGSAAPLTRNLSITLRLPLAAYKSMENLESGPENYTTSPTGESPWLRLCPSIAGLEKLHKLHIWFDHDDQSSWSVVNERALLSPLDALSRIPNLQVLTNLPKLHPKYETPERHFTKYGPAPPFTIKRRLRQRHHVVEGESCAVYEADFPLLQKYYESDMSDDEIEEFERSLWSIGERRVHEEIIARRGSSRLLYLSFSDSEDDDYGDEDEGESLSGAEDNDENNDESHH